MSLSEIDLERLGQTALQEFSQKVARSNKSKNRSFEHQAQRLEAKLEQLYAVAATMAQREASMKKVAVIWARMVSICDRMATALSGMQPGRPVRSDSYDRILDIRNVCEENRALHA